MLVRFLLFISALLINTTVVFCTPGQTEEERRAALLQHQQSLSLQTRAVTGGGLEDDDEGASGNVGRLKTLFETVEPGRIPPALLTAAGALTEEERLEEEISCGMQKFVIGLSAVSAICVSCVEGTLTMVEIQGSVFSFIFGVPEFSSFYPVVWGVGIPTVVTTLVKNYIGSHELNTWLVRATSQYGAFSQEGSHLKVVTSAVFAVALGFKPLFTLMETLGDGKEFNASEDYGYATNPLYQPEIIDLFAVAGLFWTALLVRESFLGAVNVVNSLVWGVERCQRKGLASERKKETMRQKLTFGFRRLLGEPAGALQLGRQIKKLEEAIEEKNKEREGKIKELGRQEGDGSAESEFDLKDGKSVDEQMGNLLTVRALMEFGEGEGLEAYQKLNNPRWSQAPKAFCDGHPGWYKFFYNFGRTVALAGAFSMYMGWVYTIREVLSASDETAFTLGAIVSAFFIPYMIEETGRGLANMIARCANYNPVQGSDYVHSAVEHLNQGGCNRAGRSTADVISFLSGMLVKIPAAFLGFIGIEEYLEHDMFSMPALSLFFPSLLSFAIVSRNSAERDIQGAITRLPCTRRNPAFKHQQALASTYKRADKWIKTLRPDLLDRLYEFLGQDIGIQSAELDTA